MFLQARRLCLRIPLLMGAASLSILFAGDFVNGSLPWHEAVLDPNQRLLAWYQPQRNAGYDKVIRLAWNFMEHKIPEDTRHGTGLKVYLVDTLFDDNTLQGYDWWQHNPPSTFGQFVDSVVSWYAYSGDSEAIAVVGQMLDYQLTHGTTPADWEWSHVPLATSCSGDREYGHCLEGMPRGFFGGVEPDKVGELGNGYALFYPLTGKSQYLDAAINCAQALAKHVRTGDADHTPWPFRLNARSGEVILDEEYGGMIVAPVRLFDQLIRLKAGDVKRFREARETAWNWILKQPLNPESRAWNSWTGYFADQAYDRENINQALPTMTAFYILSREDPSTVDKDWQAHAGGLIDWVRNKLGRGPYFGAWAIDEQGRPDGRACCSRAGLGSDTSRWGAINALYFERTGDAQAREDAFRSLNYASYFTASDGRVSCCGDDYKGQYEFDDGYSDYIRNFLWAMGAIPEFAPKGANHLLRSSSVVQQVAYGARKIVYRTFDANATEVLRLNFRPTNIRAGATVLPEETELRGESYSIRRLPGGDYVLHLRHRSSNEVNIS
ncbi:MAG: hypothetical protein ACR2JB_31170 [Bryobacteraceae bacterium]